MFDFPSFAVIFLLILVAIIGIGIYSYFQEKKRTEKLEELASQLGLKFFPKSDESLSSFGETYLFSLGHSKRIKNLIQGVTGTRKVSIFDYKYTVGGGKNSKTYKQTVIVFRWETDFVPNFSLRPEGVFQKIGSLFGYQDIDFESHPDFSRKYLLKSSEPKKISQVFTPKVLDYFEDNHGLSVEGHGPLLTIYKGNNRPPPEKIEAFLKEAFEILHLFFPDEA